MIELNELNPHKMTIPQEKAHLHLKNIEITNKLIQNKVQLLTLITSNLDLWKHHLRYLQVEFHY